MPSLRHEIFARLIPRIRNVDELDDEQSERERLLRWHAQMDRTFPTKGIRRFSERFELDRSEIGSDPTFPTHTLRRRGRPPRRTVLYLHGGGYTAPATATHVQYAARLATALDAEVVLPSYPLAPTHTWADSHEALVSLATDLAAARPTVLAGDSAGGGLALALAQALRDRGAAAPTHLLLHSPWVDLTTSTPSTSWFARRDPWLRLTKLAAYGRWWAGSSEDLGRPEVSPGLADLSGLPPTLMFCGTRDLLVPGCRLLARRAEEAGWDVTYVEEPGLIHVYPLVWAIPEARAAWRRTVAFLGR